MKTLEKILSAKVFVALQFIASAVFLYMIIDLGALPNKYLMIIVALVVILMLITLLLSIKANEKSIRAIICRILAVIVCIGMIVGCVEIKTGTGYIAKFNGVNYETDAISVIVMKDSEYTAINDLEGKTIGIVEEVDKENLATALIDIKENVKEAEYKTYSSMENLGNALYNNSVDAIVMNEAYRGMIEEDHPDFTNDTRVIYQVKIETETENTANNGAVDDGIFNICITGIDTYGPVSTKSRSDVNMVLTVNMNTHKILMTGIPRDYYVTLASKGAKDKLTHSGIFGVNETVNTISNLLDIDIDYYMRINFTSLVNVVDVLGGIDVYSDKTFVTHTNKEVTIHEGENHMDGAMALAFARERYAYAEGDNHRIQNQQDVMMAIIKKLITADMISNYKEILEKVDGTFETNMSTDDIMTIIKKQLSNMQGYEMQNYYLNGTGKMMTGGYCMPKSRLYYMLPNESAVKQAKENIDNVIHESIN